MSETVTRIRTTVKAGVDPDTMHRQMTGAALVPIGSSENPSNRIFTLANIVTFCRLALTIAFLVTFVSHTGRSLALACYAIAATTDFLDGQIARRTQTVSWLGKVMDPVMDRLLLFTGVLGLIITGELPAWVAAFVILRDAYLFVGALIVRRWRRRPIDVVYVGKAATACLMTGFVDMLLNVPRVAGLGLVHAPWLPGLNADPAALGIFLVYIGVLLSAITAIVYTRTGLNVIHEAQAAQPAAGRKGHDEEA